MPTTAPWKILIVDDEPAMRDVTRLVLSGFEFDGRGVEILEAGSAREARAIAALHSDIALMLVDVVMESENAGLEFVRHVRNDLANRFTRVVLRTGHPGQAPVREVIRGYDINDYKEKTELSAQKLEALICSSLRGYRDIMTIEGARAGMQRVIDASAHVHAQQRNHEFAGAVLGQLGMLLGDHDALYCAVLRPEEGEPEPLHVTGGTGRFSDAAAQPVRACLPEPLAAALADAFAARAHVFRDDHYVLHFTDRRGNESLLIAGAAPPLGTLERRLLDVFCANVAIAFENLHLNQEIFGSQLEMICLLAGAAETRSRETANHVKRVGLIAEFLAREYGLDAQTAEDLRFAAPLHDIGKIAVPDEILNKPGAHTAIETSIMRTHAERGAQLLRQTRLPLIRLAAEIALTHHENWDGSGYPRGLSGNAIPVSGRITALADVYDALGSKRCYKDAWEREEILTHLRLHRGRKFEPRLVDILIAKWDVAESIRRLLPD